MDNLPKGWCECKLEDFVNIYTGNSINEQDKVSKYTNIRSGYNYIATKDVGFDKVINYENGVKIPYENSSFKLAPAGTPLLCIEGGSAGRKVAYTNQTVCFGNKLCAFVTQFEKNSRYVYFFLQSSMFKSIFSVNKNGLIGGVSLNKIKKININLPPLAEQERIVEKIEELFSEIDEGIKNLKTAQLQLKQYRQSVLKSAFEGKLYKTTDWKVVTIKQLVSQEKNSLKAGPFGSTLKKEFYVNQGYKIYGQEQVISQNPYYGDYYINENLFNKLLSCKVKPNDVLVSLVGTIGKVLILPENIEEGIINPRLIKVTLDQQIYLPIFFKYYFESQYLRSLFTQKAHGATMDILNMTILKELPFVLPTLPEQERIVEEIEKRFEAADEMEKAIKESLEDAQKLKQSILKKAFSGQLVPQNPDDEPASILLERIKASNSVQAKGKRK